MTSAVMGETVVEARRRLRKALLEAGGVVGDGKAVAAASQPLPDSRSGELPEGEGGILVVEGRKDGKVDGGSARAV